jgi:hypothetical protein
MESLNTQTVNTNFNIGAVGSTYQNGPNFTVQVPQSSVLLAKPLSYKFRVAEYVDEKGSIVKVGLQVATFEHDNYGSRQLRQDWTDVERVQLPYKP